MTARAAQTKPGKGFRWVRWIKSDGRALQIINNVSEEYVDHGRTDFATPEELCQTILWLQKTHSADFMRKDACLDKIVSLAVKGRLYRSRARSAGRK